MSDIGKKPIASMPLDTLLKGTKQIIDKELQPLRTRVTALETENRLLRERLNQRQGGSASGRFQPLRRS